MHNQMHAEQMIRDREREIRKRIGHARPERQAPPRSVRRAVGRSIIKIGRRIAAEPQPRLARAR